MDFDFKYFEDGSKAIDWIVIQIYDSYADMSKKSEAIDFIKYLYDLAQYYET